MVNVDNRWTVNASVAKERLMKLEQTAPQLKLEFVTKLTVMQQVPKEHCQRKTDRDRVEVPLHLGS